MKYIRYTNHRSLSSIGLAWDGHEEELVKNVSFTQTRREISGDLPQNNLLHTNKAITEIESTLQACATATCLHNSTLAHTRTHTHNFIKILGGFIFLFLVSVTIHFLPFFGRTELFLSFMLCSYHNYYIKVPCLHLAKSNLFNANLSLSVNLQET